MGLTPSALDVLDPDADYARNLATLLVGGEACPPELLARWSRPGRLFLNAYGPTETTVCSSQGPMAADDPLVTIGTMNANYKGYVLDDRLRRLPTPDPSVAAGTREQILASYREVRDMLALRLRKLFAIEPPTD